MQKNHTQSALTFDEKDLLVKGFKDKYKLKKKLGISTLLKNTQIEK